MEFKANNSGSKKEPVQLGSSSYTKCEGEYNGKHTFEKSESANCSSS